MPNPMTQPVVSASKADAFRPLTTTKPQTSNYQEAPDVWWGQHGIDALIHPKPYEVPLLGNLAANDAPPPAGEAV